MEPDREMASSSSSQSPSFLPTLAENEVELVIDKFWRNTRPRVCIRSETKIVRGFAFRLLVWPQGSKQSQNFLSAFVEVVPVTTSPGAYPSDWGCPSVFYKISVLNFKQKWVYAKTDTWTFSYVCPDRGWHTLLDTRYINRRDGYLSKDGSLIMRATVYPRFAAPVSVLPLRRSLCPPFEGPKLRGILGLDHLSCLITSWYHLPAVRKLIYSITPEDEPLPKPLPSATVDVEATEALLDSVCVDLRNVMEIVTGKSAAVDKENVSQQPSLISRLFSRTGSSAEESLRQRHLKSLVVIDQLQEVIDDMARVGPVSDVANHKAVLSDCRTRLLVSDCVRALFPPAQLSNYEPLSGECLVRELQLLFARMEVSLQPCDMSGVVKALGLLENGLVSQAVPERLIALFFDKLKDSCKKLNRSSWEKVSSYFHGTAAAPNSTTSAYAFNHLRFNNGRSTTIEKHLACWTSPPTASDALLTIPEAGATGAAGCRFTTMPPVLHVQFLNKVRDRMDITETVDFEPFCAPEVKNGKAKLLYRLHSILVAHGGNGSDTSTAAGQYQHYSLILRSHRRAPWQRVDDGVVQDMSEASLPGIPGGGVDWVFSPEWACAGLCYVREDAEDKVYERGVDVRHLRRDLLPHDNPLSLPAEPLLPPAPAEVIAPHQLEVIFVTEKDLVTFAPQGFFSVFKEPLVSRLSAGARKLLVRRDVGVERLMEAVHEFFKIPVAMQKLFALHFFSDVQQERFELMLPNRAVASYLASHCAPGALRLAPRASQAESSSLVVLVNARKNVTATPASEATLWWKYLAADLTIKSGGVLTVELNKKLEDYFDIISGRAKLSGPLQVYEEFGPRLVERKRHAVTIKDEALCDGDIIIFTERSESEKAAKSIDAIQKELEDGLQWVESLLPLFLKRKRPCSRSSPVTSSTRLLSGEGSAAYVLEGMLGCAPTDSASESSDGDHDDDVDDDESISLTSCSDDDSIYSEEGITGACTACGARSRNGLVSVRCSLNCKPKAISFHVPCLGEILVRQNRLPDLCCLTPGCKGKLLSDSNIISSPPVPAAPPKMNLAAIRSRFDLLCCPPDRPTSKKTFTVPPAPRLPPADEPAPAAARKKVKPFGTFTVGQMQTLWWKACLHTWTGDVQVASEFVLAAEVSGKAVVDDHASVIYFAWLHALSNRDRPVTPPVTAEASTIDSPDQVITPVHVDQPQPAVHANAAAEESAPEDWHQVSAKKVKKPVRVTPAPVLKPRDDSTAWLAEVVQAGRFVADHPQVASESTSSLVKDRCALLAPALTQFCLPASLVFVYKTETSTPAVNAVAALAPVGADVEQQIEKVLGAAAACNVIRAFVAPAESSRSRWFVEVSNAEDVALVIKWMKVNMPSWQTSAGSLITCSS